MARTPLASVLSLYALGTNAADPSCTTQATEKKLAGAAKISFMNKCVRWATAVLPVDNTLASNRACDLVRGKIGPSHRGTRRLPENREAGCAMAAIDLQEQEVVGGELARIDIVQV